MTLAHDSILELSCLLWKSLILFTSTRKGEMEEN